MQVIREVMEFRSYKETNIIIGLVTAALSAFNLAFFFIVREDGISWFDGFTGFSLLLISAASFTYSNLVNIDKQGNLVEKITQALFLKKRQIRSVWNFRGVGIFRAGKRKYFVKLLGSKNMSIPGIEIRYEDALMKAEDIGQFLNLPVDGKPKFGHFWT